jgi:hypothetical protein
MKKEKKMRQIITKTITRRFAVLLVMMMLVMSSCTKVYVESDTNRTGSGAKEAPNLVITRQPVDWGYYDGTVGNEAYWQCETKNPGYVTQYQWYWGEPEVQDGTLRTANTPITIDWNNPNVTAQYPTGVNQSMLYFRGGMAGVTYSVYCVITSSNGETVKTNTVSATKY